MLISFFIGVFLLTLTILSIYNGFGPHANSLKDPFEQHET